VIRNATPADVAELAHLFAGFRDWWDKDEPRLDSIQATLEELLADPKTDFLLAVDDGGKPVGFAQLRYRLSVWTGADDCWLEDLFVEKDAQGAGHGRALVEASFDAARARGCTRIELDVNEENENAFALYVALGFNPEPKPPGKTRFISRPL